MASLQSRIVYQNSAVTPLGAIKFAGYIQNSSGADQGARRRLGSFALVYSLRGECSYWDERTGHRTVGPGELFFLFPGVAHRYGGAPNAWDEFYMIFEGPLFELWRAQGLIDPDRPFLKLLPVDHWLARLQGCLETHGCLGRDAALRQVAQLQQVIIDALTLHGPVSARHPPWLPEACEVLGAFDTQRAHLATLARSLGVSFETFRKQFTVSMGTTPAAYRGGRLIDEASRLLSQGELSGKEIAARLGYSDEYHFSRRFKEITGMTPTEFRRRGL